MVKRSFMGVYPVNSSLLFAIFIQLVVKRQLHECLIKNLEKIMAGIPQIKINE